MLQGSFEQVCVFVFMMCVYVGNLSILDASLPLA